VVDDRLPPVAGLTEAHSGESGAKKHQVELVRGSGIVFAILAFPTRKWSNLTAKIIAVLDEKGTTVRHAHELTGFAAADFSRVRQAKLASFMIDRLITMLDRLNKDVEVTVTVQPRRALPRTALTIGISTPMVGWKMRDDSTNMALLQN
jgi:predicted XRE-type DNA-binding protein